VSLYSDNYSLAKAEISKHKKKLESKNYIYKGTARLFIKGCLYKCPVERAKFNMRLSLYISVDPVMYLTFYMLSSLSDKGDDIYDRIVGKILYDKSAFKERAQRSPQDDDDIEHIEFVINWMGLAGMGLTQRQQVIYTLEKHVIEINKIKEALDAKTTTSA